MNTQSAMENTQGFIYRGQFSETLDIMPLREKISKHLSFVRAVKNNEETADSHTVEFSLEVKEHSK